MNRTEVRHIDITDDTYDTLRLKCIVYGIPPPNITWYKVRHLYFKYNYLKKVKLIKVNYILFFYNFQNSTILEGNNQYLFSPNHQELYIQYLRQNDSGKYLLRATNRYGTIETYEQIKIQNIGKFNAKTSKI